MEKHPRGDVERLAGIGPRIGAFLIDSVLVGVVSVAIGFVFGLLGLVGGGEGAMPVVAGLLNLLLPLLLFLYFIAMEAVYGYTLGKLALGLVVVTESGDPIGWGDSAIRNVLRIVDALPFFYIVGLALIAITDEEQRVGDLAASTLVVKQA